MTGAKVGSYLIALLLFAVGVFYAFNALIQIRERGFSEPRDIPIAIVSIAIGGFIFIAARRR